MLELLYNITVRHVSIKESVEGNKQLSKNTRHYPYIRKCMSKAISVKKTAHGAHQSGRNLRKRTSYESPGDS